MDKEKWLPFEEAREFVRKLELKGKNKWFEYCKFENKPKNIPNYPNEYYKNKWGGWDDFLGVKQFATFEDAKIFAQSLGFKSGNEWKKYCKSGNKPDCIPSAVSGVYRNRGWKGWGDFLGTGNIAVFNKNFRPFKDAAKFVQELNLKNSRNWHKYCKSGNKPDDIPYVPSSTYKDDGWISMGDWLGSKNIAVKYVKFSKSFEEVRKFAHSLNLKSGREWKENYCKSGNKPIEIPSRPDVIYKKEWKGWADFIGTNNTSPQKSFLPFENAREIVHSLNLKSRDEWETYRKSKNRFKGIPTNPNIVYKNKGWISFGDWLGTNIGFSGYLSFEDARKYVCTLYLKLRKHWDEYCKSGKKPNNIPFAPHLVYKNEGWIGMGDFLGTGRIAQKDRVYKTFEEAKTLVHLLKFKSQIEWFIYTKSENKPDDIPTTPDRVYKKEWCGWAHFLGYLGNGNIWSNKALVTYLEEIKDYLHVCTIPQLMTIIESNGLFNYLTKEKLKKLQDTRPDSKERKIATDEVIAELTCNKELDEIAEELSEVDINEIVNETIDASDEEDSKDNTELREKELKSLGNNITSSLDDERIQFLVSDFVNNLWYDVLNHKLDINRIKNLELDQDVPQSIREKFIAEYEAVSNLIIPEGYTYQHAPLLMQKLIAYRLADRKRYGNWSGAGAGKTIGAILAGRYVGAKNTLIITFNSTIGEEDTRGWTQEVRDCFADSKIYTKIGKHITFDNRYNNYLILNYETFQQKGSANYVIDLLERNKFDYVILDEVQSVKQTFVGNENQSKRREVIFGLIGKVRELNPDYYLMPMSATPVINNLVEAKSLVELIEFTDLDDVDTRANIPNCIELFRRLTNCGIRHKNIEDNILKNNEFTLVDVEANHLFNEVELIASDDFLGKDRLVLEAKLEAIKPYINSSKGKTIIYTYYVDGIDDFVYNYLTNLGYKVGMYTGGTSKRSREESLSEFISGKYDILLGSKPISTGVNKLQYVSDRIIILSLPWTDAEMEQLTHRINRKGSYFTEEGIDVIIPLVSISDGKKTHNWDLHKYNRITYKATVANAAVDGIIPDKLIPSRDTIIKNADDVSGEWLERLKSGNILTVDRKELEVKLFPDITDEEQRRHKINSELSEFNRVGKTTLSSTMNKRFNDNPESWHYYHKLRRESMKDWDEIPYEVIAKEITCESDIVVDFGCGDNQFKSKIPNNKVTSVDHVACDETVIACDMCDLSKYISDESHDVAVFSLSLWGTNYKDYIKEAYRVLKRKGLIYIAEPVKHYETVEEQNELKKLLGETGFKVVGNIDVREKFIYITGIKM